MRIASSQILLGANHALTEKHTRQESLVVGVSSTGAWNADALEGGAVRALERNQIVDPAGDSAGSSNRSLLDEYLGGRSLDSVEREAAAIQAGPDASAMPTSGRRPLPPASAAGAGDVRSDLEILQELASREPRLAGLEDIARMVTSGGTLDADRLGRAAATGSALPDLGILSRGLASMADGEGSDLLSRLFEATLPMPLDGYTSLDSSTDPVDRLKMELIRSALSVFAGRDIELLEPSDLNFDSPTGTYADMAAKSGSAADTAQATEGASEGDQAPAGPAFGLAYSRRETHYERETTTFAAQGVVRTADGEEIEVDVSLTMGRQFYSEESVEVRVGAALQDPLVVNFEGTAAELTERTYAFDLDADGEAEQIHFVGPNSGFLAYDRNGNGSVDDGSELFGPSTGQGFAELSNYDDDGNQFIDEADKVYEGLRIWQKDAGGNDRLMALGQAGVGAIYLGHTDTPFQVKDTGNQLQGVVRSSGIYLKEDGGAGTVQQLDLVV